MWKSGETVISEAAVLEALKGVRDATVDRDIVSAKFVKDVKIDGGRVSFTVEQAIHGASTRQQVGEQSGARVAMIDGDVYGPNVPIMLGVSTQLTTDGQRIVPADQYGIQLVSMAFLTQDDVPVIWRGPMLHGVVQQFFREVAWDDVDYLIVDLPPGTGDVALSLSQSVPVAGAVLVTTPQTVSLADTRRAVKMYEKLSVTPMGLI